jgi:hypothetical protein
LLSPVAFLVVAMSFPLFMEFFEKFELAMCLRWGHSVPGPQTWQGCKGPYVPRRSPSDGCRPMSSRARRQVVAHRIDSI